ncbi:hypothetical protein H2198_001329 [Neophaeococcomyces mojaviensis]|uniref:Uncharacterized protein n=1 Tax=Neophaeococcomyces mojaviensis TaxID=3383035 RepID=A0ACC3AHP1_9EURO|nr:hypothetical protein H2198_001329 [Knufia sp. JES_112]
MSYYQTLSFSDSPLPNPLERYRTPFSTFRLQWLSRGRLELEARRAEPRLRFLLGHAYMVENITNTMNRHRCDTSVSRRSSHNDGSAQDASRDTSEGHEYSTRTASWGISCSGASFPSENYPQSRGEATKEAKWSLLRVNTTEVEEDDQDSEDDSDYEDDSSDGDDEDDDEGKEDGEDREDVEDVYEACAQRVQVKTCGVSHGCEKKDSNAKPWTKSASDLTDSSDVVDQSSPNCAPVQKPLCKGRPVQWHKRSFCCHDSGQYLVQQPAISFWTLNHPTLEHAWWRAQGLPLVTPSLSLSPHIAQTKMSQVPDSPVDVRPN